MICNPQVAVVSPEDEKTLVVAAGVSAGRVDGGLARELRLDLYPAKAFREHGGR